MLKFAERDINDALDILSDVYGGCGSLVSQCAEEIKIMCFDAEAREPTEDEKWTLGKLRDLDELAHFEVKDWSNEKRLVCVNEIERIRREAMRGLFEIAIGCIVKATSIEQVRKQIDDNYKAILARVEKLSQGVCCSAFTGDAAKDMDGISRDAARGAAKTKKKFETAAKHGRASARTKKEEAEEDHVKNTIIAEVNKLKRERDENHPDRNKGGEKGPSDNQIYQTAANKHIGANGKPIYAPKQIKEWFKPSKVARRGGHKRK